jgi:hypothetical protein
MIGKIARRILNHIEAGSADAIKCRRADDRCLLAQVRLRAETRRKSAAACLAVPLMRTEIPGGCNFASAALSFKLSGLPPRMRWHGAFCVTRETSRCVSFQIIHRVVTWPAARAAVRSKASGRMKSPLPRAGIGFRMEAAARYLPRRGCIAKPRVAQRTLGGRAAARYLPRRGCIAKPRVAQRTLGGHPPPGIYPEGVA